MPLKASSVPALPPFYKKYSSLKHNIGKFSVWFSAGSAVISSEGFARGWSFPTVLTAESGMWYWRHSRSWECFAFFFLAVVRWLPARVKDNSFQKRKKERRKRTVYNQTIVEEALLYWARIEIRIRCLAFWYCTNVKCID